MFSHTILQITFTTISFPSRLSLILILSLSLVSFQLIPSTNAHDHSSHLPPPPSSLPPTPSPPILIHILLQLLSWGVLLPAGALLGLARSRLHAPLQLLAGLLIGLPATNLPHLSSSHPYADNAHAHLGTPLAGLLLAQIGSGIFLKSHLAQHSYLRAAICHIHAFVGKLFPILSWTQILLGSIASLGFCLGDHTGQCLAHFIMGSAFIAYGAFTLAMSRFGQAWLSEKTISQDFLDSLVIMIWGIVNTFTEHGVFFSAGWHWSHKDMQHTTLGVFWATAGLLGLYLSRSGRRTVLPGLVVILSGWVFQAHEQAYPISTEIHGAFGATLAIAGVLRTVEVGWGSRKPAVDDRELDAVEHLAPLLLTIAGVMFMSATEEQLLLIVGIGMDHATYVLCQASLGSLLYLYMNLMMSLYRRAVSQQLLRRADQHSQSRSAQRVGYESLGMAILSPPHTPRLAEEHGQGTLATKSARQKFETPELIVTCHDDADEGSDHYWVDSP